MNTSEATSYLEERFQNSFIDISERGSAWVDGKTTYIETRDTLGDNVRWNLTTESDDTDVVYDIAVPNDPVGIVQLIQHMERKSWFEFGPFLDTLMPAIQEVVMNDDQADRSIVRERQH